MKVCTRYLHQLTKSTFSIGILTCPGRKNEAYELIHKKYIGEAKDPWDFDPNSPSKIRVEKRHVRGKWTSTLVDDFESTATLGGMLRESDGKLVATTRVLLRSDMPDGTLEIERYSTLPEDIRDYIQQHDCNIELNRMAVDDSIKGMRSILIPYSTTMAHIGGSANGRIVATLSRGYMERCGLDRFYIGSFKYDPRDADPAAVISASVQDFTEVAHAYAAGGGFEPVEGQEDTAAVP